VFLMQLKQEHPQVIVVTISANADSHSLIELINSARIYRFLKLPATFEVLTRYLYAAFDLLRRQKANPSLLRRQRAEPLPDALREAPTTEQAIKRLRQTGRGIFRK